jgi:hypothetical protein
LEGTDVEGHPPLLEGFKPDDATGRMGRAVVAGGMLSVVTALGVVVSWSVKCVEDSYGSIFFNMISIQGCQIFLSTTYQNREMYTKLPQNIPNVNKVY